MTAIWKRELKALFCTPVGYVFMAFFLLVSGFFFWGYNLSPGSSDMSSFFNRVVYILTLFTPILTMRLFSEEKRNRTDQLLFTAPVPLASVTAGKFFAVATVLAATLTVTLVYPLIIALFGTLSAGTVFTNYIGCFLMGCVYLSVGILISSLCENQITAAVATLVVNIMLQVLENVPQMLSSGSWFFWVAQLFGWLSLNNRNRDFASGLLSPSNALYLCSLCFVMLFLTTRMLDRRRYADH